MCGWSVQKLGGKEVETDGSMLEKTTGRKDGCHLYRNILKTMELLLENVKIPTISFIPPYRIANTSRLFYITSIAAYCGN
jgi:hypothetical protein